jgi:hypothetical protein
LLSSTHSRFLPAQYSFPRSVYNPVPSYVGKEERKQLRDYFKKMFQLTKKLPQSELKNELEKLRKEDKTGNFEYFYIWNLINSMDPKEAKEFTDNAIKFINSVEGYNRVLSPLIEAYNEENPGSLADPNNPRFQELKIKSPTFDPEELFEYAHKLDPNVRWDKILEGVVLNDHESKAFLKYCDDHHIDLLKFTQDFKKEVFNLSKFPSLNTPYEAKAIAQAFGSTSPVYVKYIEGILENLKYTRSHDTKHDYLHSSMWLKYAKVALVVVLLFCIYVQMLGHDEHHHKPNYPHLRIRNKDFPWGQKDLLDFREDEDHEDDDHDEDH